MKLPSHISSGMRALVSICAILSASAEIAIAGSCGAPKTASTSVDPHKDGTLAAPQFICPADGIVVIQCWTRSDDKLVLAVHAGAPVRAVSAGTVAYAGDFGSFDGLIVIRHPRGLASVYAHVGTFEVKRGDRVEPGRVISTMTSENGTTGSELLFQLLDRGKPVDPSGYVKCH